MLSLSQLLRFYKNIPSLCEETLPVVAMMSGSILRAHKEEQSPDQVNEEICRFLSCVY